MNNRILTIGLVLAALSCAGPITTPEATEQPTATVEAEARSEMARAYVTV